MMKKKSDYPEGLLEQKLVEGHELYDVYDEVWLTYDEGMPSDDTMDITIARNKSGDYIGQPEMAEALCSKYGISPQRREGANVCNFGWSEKEQKAFGWSHRALIGFGIGDKIFNEDEKGEIDKDGRTPFTQCGHKEIETKEDALLAAQNFGEYIG